MDDHLTYARPEIERRYLLTELPAALSDPVRIRDRYLTGTRLRVRRVETLDGATLQLELGQKIRPKPGDQRLIMHTTLYLSPSEYEILIDNPGRNLVKVRYRYNPTEGASIDVHESPNPGVILLEVNFDSVKDSEAYTAPDFVDFDVTGLDEFTGRRLACRR